MSAGLSSSHSHARVRIILFFHTVFRWGPEQLHRVTVTHSVGIPSSWCMTVTGEKLVCRQREAVEGACWCTAPRACPGQQHSSSDTSCGNWTRATMRCIRCGVTGSTPDGVWFSVFSGISHLASFLPLVTGPKRIGCSGCCNSLYSSCFIDVLRVLVGGSSLVKSTLVWHGKHSWVDVYASCIMKAISSSLPSRCFTGFRCNSSF